MLLPELQRVAQSIGITGTARMRKGQLIAAIEERRQGASSQDASPARRNGARSRAAVAPDSVPVAHQIETSDNPVQRRAPAGAGADRTFEQDAMESQTSTQPGLGGSSASGIGEASRSADAGIGSAPAGGATATDGGSTAVNGTPRDDAQQAGDGQRPDRRRRSAPRRDDAGDQPRAASDGQDAGGRDQQGGRDQGGRDQTSRDQREPQGGREQGGRDGGRDQNTRDQNGRDQGARDQQGGGRDQGGRTAAVTRAEGTTTTGMAATAAAGTASATATPAATAAASAAAVAMRPSP